MYAFIDIETGGFSITKNGVCEIALLITDENFNIQHEFSQRIKPYTRPDSDELVSYKEDAMAVNGIKEQDLHDNGYEVSEVMKSIILALTLHKPKKIIGHNSDLFDIPRINYLLERFLGPKLTGYEFDDTLKISKQKLSLPSYSLQKCCDHFVIENKKAHSALGDAYATMELYKKLI